MTIDEAIKQFKEDAEYNRADLDLEWAEENEQVAKWLEELKAYKTCNEGKFIHYKESVAYNKAIDDISRMIKDWCYEEVPTDILLQRLTEIKECK